MNVKEIETIPLDKLKEHIEWLEKQLTLVNRIYELRNEIELYEEAERIVGLEDSES